MTRRALELLYRLRILKRPIVVDYIWTKAGAGHVRLRSGRLRIGTRIDVGGVKFVVGGHYGHGLYTVSVVP